MEAFAVFETGLARRHLSALCHHFGRKVEAHCAANTGHVRFAIGELKMKADDHCLELVVEAADQKHLNQVMQILVSHLERFAFRENPHLVWRSSSNEILKEEIEI